MRNNIIKTITPSVRILILILLILTLFLSNSKLLTLFVTVLTFLILILSNRTLNLYIQSIKKSTIWLIFSFAVYIIIYGSIIGSIVFLYKLILTIILIKCFILSTSFNELNSGIYKLLSPLKKFNLNIKHLSFNTSLYTHYIMYLRDSSNIIEKSQVLNNKKSYSVKYLLLPKIMLSIDSIKNLENHLKLNFYNIKEEKLNTESILLLVVFIILFLIVIFKEVIL